MSNIVYTKVGHRGQEIYAFKIEKFEGAVAKEDITLENNYLDTSIDRFLAMKTGRTSEGVTDVKQDGEGLYIEVMPFAYESPFVLKIKDTELTTADFPEVKTDWADLFEAYEDGDLLYRLYSPQAKAQRPLILFLHGGGEGGRDNWRQLTCSFGAAAIAERFPDCYVMAPQAKDNVLDPSKLKQSFAESTAAPDTGWNRQYLGQVCDVIRNMIKEGKVDEKRVYVTGLSMGGAGTIRAMSVGRDLFTAAAPICPSMMPETYDILRSLTDAKVWVSTAYIDHSLYRHKYIVDAVMQLKDAGNKNAHLTIYSPEELAAYDIGVIEDMPLKALFGWNHLSWVLTYNNEYGIMDWLVAQTK